jgi:hypothetical protein
MERKLSNRENGVNARVGGWAFGALDVRRLA